MKYTADLVINPDNSKYHNPRWPEGVYIYWGLVFNDTKERFMDGERIHTSEVLSETPEYITTRNSVYRKRSLDDIEDFRFGSKRIKP